MINSKGHRIGTAELECAMVCELEYINVFGSSIRIVFVFFFGSRTMNLELQRRL